jgi:hypothetical protein
VAPAEAQAPPAPRLAFDSSGADTATCQGIHLTFQAFRNDPVAGNGFQVTIRNRSDERQNFDPTRFRAVLPSGRRVSFLGAGDISSQFLQGPRAAALDTDERFRQQQDILRDPRFRSGAVLPSSGGDRFLALGWTRTVSGDPSRLLPMTLFCGDQRLGLIGPAGAEQQR